MIKDKVIISTEVQDLQTNPMVKFCISVTNEDYEIDRAEITVSEMEAIAELFKKQDSVIVKAGSKDAVSNPNEWLDYAMQIKLILLDNIAQSTFTPESAAGDVYRALSTKLVSKALSNYYSIDGVDIDEITEDEQGE
tara:strand:- start:1440 stop:1850 length:411 start_codon:yes stop_codon:yes gene_type:complete